MSLKSLLDVGLVEGFSIIPYGTFRKCQHGTHDYGPLHHEKQSWLQTLFDSQSFYTEWTFHGITPLNNDFYLFPDKTKVGMARIDVLQTESLTQNIVNTTKLIMFVEGCFPLL